MRIRRIPSTCDLLHPYVSLPLNRMPSSPGYSCRTCLRSFDDQSAINRLFHDQHNSKCASTPLLPRMNPPAIMGSLRNLFRPNRSSQMETLDYKRHCCRQCGSYFDENVSLHRHTCHLHRKEDYSAPNSSARINPATNTRTRV